MKNQSCWITGRSYSELLLRKLEIKVIHAHKRYRSSQIKLKTTLIHLEQRIESIHEPKASSEITEKLSCSGPPRKDCNCFDRE